MLEWVCWIGLFLIAYPYAIYPFVLVGFNRLSGRRLPAPDATCQPTVSIVMPVHNERGKVPTKIRNLLELDYPAEKVQIVVVGDGCTDDSLDLARAAGGGRVLTLALEKRSGKAAGLNAGVQSSTGEIVVFTDAGIALEKGSLAALVGHFRDPAVGCVSGEDYLQTPGGEGLYGKLELLLRREEAQLHSIAGASGCFYAQRRSLVRPFIAGMAPDFLSVLHTVAQGHRAICEPAARGYMTATKSQGAEFVRKVRTFLRGLTALFGNAHLLNPFRHPAFSFVLLSHKLARWFAPVPMAAVFVASVMLAGSPLYAALLGAQIAFYSLAVAGLVWPSLSDRFTLVRLSAFFVLVNVAALKAVLQWARGERLEIWQPTRRPG